MLSGLRCNSAPLAAGGRVLAAAYDESDSRLVTADERHELRVFDRDGDAWRSRVAWKAHDAKLRGVAWASPVFGSILASCANDGAVKVWLILPAGEAKLLATLGGGRAAPVCVAFAPQHQGLVLAVACADGAVRLYESAARTGAAWEEQGVFDAGAASCTALAWCLHGAARPPALAVAVVGAPARVWAFDAEQRRWSAACELPGGAFAGVAWARNDGRPWELLAGFSGARVLVWRVTFGGTRATAEAAAQPFVHGGDVCSLSWDFTGTRLAAAALDGRVRLWSADLLGEWGEYTA